MRTVELTPNDVRIQEEGVNVQSNYQVFSHLASSNRISAILEAADVSAEEATELPPRDRLTFANGFYANCTAIFIDMRDSSSLPDKHKRPTLAKLYRVFISEMVAVMNGNKDCVEINIEGDAVWGVFNTRTKKSINNVFVTACFLASETDILNCWFRSKGITEISVGIGVSYGRALMIKAGFFGSKINDVVYMGEVVNEASQLSDYGNRTGADREIMVSSDVQFNLSDDNKSLLEWNNQRSCYHGNIVSITMDRWVEENCG